MNNKKLLALLCATAMASSTLVPVISASADETTALWSDTFDLCKNVTTGEYGLDGVELLVSTKSGTTSYDGIPGITLYANTRGVGAAGDDTSYILAEAVEDGSDDIAIKTSISRFSTESRGAKITFDETYAASGDNALVLAAKVKIDVVATNTYAPAFRIGNVVITNTMLGEDNTWADLKLAYYQDGTYEVLVNEVFAASGMATSTSFDFNFTALDATGAVLPNASSAKCADGYHAVSLDDVVVYEAADIYAEAPAAQTQVPDDYATPSPSPEPKAAPAVEVPADGIKVLSQDFNASAAVSYSQGTTGVDVTEGDIRFTIGGRGDGADASTYVSITENVAGDNMLATSNGRFGNSGREIKLYLADNTITANTLSADGYASFSFAAKLAPTDTYAAELYFLDSTTSAVIETITTDETATSGIYVPANKWVLIEYLMYADGAVYINVDGTDYPVAVTSTTLPNIGTHDGSANAKYTGADFDNFVVYVVSDGYVVSTPTPEPEIPEVVPFDSSATIDFVQDMNSVPSDLANYFGTTGTTYTDIDGIAYTIGGRAEGPNGDTTNVRIKTDSYANQYLYAETHKYGANGRAPRIEITGAPKLEQLATDDDYVAMSFAAKLIPGSAGPATLVFPMTTQFSVDGNYYVFNAGTLTTEEGQATSVPANTWMVIDVTVYKTGAYEIYVDNVPMITGDVVGSAGGGSDTMKLTALPFITTNDCEEATYASYAIDNLVVYHTGDLTVVETPEPVAAPSISAAKDTVLDFSENFNKLDTTTTKMATTSQVVPVGKNVEVVLGSRDENGATGESSSDAQLTAVSVKTNCEGDKVLGLTTGKFGTITRAPKVLIDSADASTLGEDEYVEMAFAFRLNNTGIEGQASALTFIADPYDVTKSDESNSETKNDGNTYGYVYGAVTANEADVDDKTMLVDANVWHTALVTVYSDGEWFVEIDGAVAFTGNGLAYSNGDKIGTSKLPSLVIGKNVKDTKPYANVDIDNLVVYSSVAPAAANVAFTGATATEATLTSDMDAKADVIVASYDADGRLAAVTTTTAKLVAGDNTVTIAANAGDKVMAWTVNNVVPYGNAVVVE